MCKVRVDGMRLEHMSEFKYFRCVLDESGTDEVEYCRKLWSGSKAVGTIRYLVNASDLQLECVRMLHNTVVMPVLWYGSETMIWMEKERSRIRFV